MIAGLRGQWSRTATVSGRRAAVEAPGNSITSAAGRFGRRPETSSGEDVMKHDRKSAASIAMGRAWRGLIGAIGLSLLAALGPATASSDSQIDGLDPGVKL